MISLAGLRFSYDRAAPVVLHDLSLDIPPNTVTAILGPNGSGKTTLLHILLGRLSPQQGTISLAGQPQRAYSRQALSRLIGLVPQDEYIPFDFSLLEYVLLGRAPYLGLLEMPGEADRQAAVEALATTGLTALQQRTVPSLSGGERQLAWLARALAQKPRILLLDEPTSHLDLSNRGRVLQVLRALTREGVTVVFTTHDPNAAAEVADYVVLLRAGQTLAAGPTAQALTAANLSQTYDAPVSVIEAHGRLVVVPLIAAI